MYAQLTEANEFGLDGKPLAVYRKSQAIEVIKDGVRYNAPSNWMTMWSIAEKAYYNIYPLVENFIDEKTQVAVGEPVYSFDGANVNAVTATNEASLETFKTVKINDLEMAYSNELAQPVFLTFGGTEYAFSTDEKPKTLMFNALTALNSGMPFPANFKWSSIDWPDNVAPTHEQTVAVINETQFRDIAQAVLIRDYSTNKKFIELREDVDNATTRIEVDAIVW